MSKPRLTNRIIEALIEATGEALSGTPDDTRTPAEVRALHDADAWARGMREYRQEQKKET